MRQIVGSIIIAIGVLLLLIGSLQGYYYLWWFGVILALVVTTPLISLGAIIAGFHQKLFTGLLIFFLGLMVLMFLASRQYFNIK